MGRTDRSKEGTGRNPNEGTSARTRAFCFEDIMSRRNKKHNSNSNDKDSKLKDTFESANNYLDHTSPDRHQIVMASKDTVKDSSKKEESSSRRERDLMKRRYTSAHDLEGAKVKSIHRKSDRDQENTDERYSHHLSKTGNFPAVSEKPSGRKRLEDFEKDKYEEHYRKSKRDRKSDSHNDDKIRAENAKKSKKNDFVRQRNVKYFERNGHKNYHMEPFYEELRLRRRSRSLGYDSEREMSASLSPLSHKQAYQVQDYGESYKDNSRKKHSDGDRYKTSGDVDRYKSSGDVDRCKTSGDTDRYKASGHTDRYKASGDADRYKASGDADRYKTSGDVVKYKTSGDVDKYKTSGDGGYSGGHHRKQGSGLGGYSPRKRKSEAAVKTPSPTVRSPERKVATWDQLPSGTNITSTGSIFTNFPLAASKIVEAASSITATPAAAKIFPVTSINSTVVMNASLESVQLTQATRPMRRLYIENLPPSATEKSVIDFLNEILVSSGANLVQIKPCISCIINKDKAQALVEFLTPEDATAALSFDGNSLFGSVLKMRRPKDFIEAAIGVPEKTGDVIRIVSDVVMDSPYKIFVGGFSDILTSNMFMEIASAFGPLKAYHSDFNKDLNGLCAFLEYEDHSITSKACAVLDGLMLGGCILTAVRASPDINGKDYYASPPSYAVPSHAKPLLASVSPVLKLQNVINPEDLPTLTGNELEETIEDIRLECARFGSVKTVHIVRHSSNINEPKSEASQLSETVNTSAGLESNVNSHNGSTEKVCETHHEDIGEASTSNYVRVIKEDEMQEATVPLEDLQDIGKGTNVQTKESFLDDANVTSKFSSPKEMQDTNLAEDTNLDPVAACKEEDNGNNEQKLVEGDLKGSGELQAHVPDDFAPGCVLVEFQRKEAACIAAHCLHGRSYGELTVEVEYIPYDVYLKRFPK